MIVSFHGEYSWDLAAVAPFAYWLHQHGELEKTIGPVGSKPIYFFSPNHEENGMRMGGNTSFNPLEGTGCVVGGDIYEEVLHTEKWTLPPYKEHFKNTRFTFDKPLLIINNKYTEEWRKPPVNFLGVEVLFRICRALCDKYQIVYIRPTFKERGIADDGHELYDWFDYEVLRHRFGGKVLFFNDLLAINPDLGFNDLQFMLSANCERFISVQGGNAFVSCCFGGKNIVYANAKSEHTKCYWPGAYTSHRFGCDVHFVHSIQLNVVGKALELYG
jgi:hypothetical protein